MVTSSKYMPGIRQGFIPQPKIFLKLYRTVGNHIGVARNPPRRPDQADKPI
jgi:hypothetical protein